MTYHQLKINKEFADAVSAGDKTFEIRSDDRNFRVGHRIIFQAVDMLLPIDHPINNKRYEITYILGEPWTIPKHVALAIKEVRKHDD